MFPYKKSTDPILSVSQMMVALSYTQDWWHHQKRGCIVDGWCEGVEKIYSEIGKGFDTASFPVIESPNGEKFTVLFMGYSEAVLKSEFSSETEEFYIAAISDYRLTGERESISLRSYK